MGREPQTRRTHPNRDPTVILAAELTDLPAYITGAVRQARCRDQIAAWQDSRRIPSVWAADQPARGRRPWLPP
jgi:hypothetical protein